MPTLYARAIRRAADICGADLLAERLGVTRTQLSAWMSGIKEPSTEVFLKVADILGEKTIEELKRRPAPPNGGDPDVA